jgi:hypothetical protein
MAPLSFSARIVTYVPEAPFGRLENRLAGPEYVPLRRTSVSPGVRQDAPPATVCLGAALDCAAAQLLLFDPEGET